MPSLDQSKLPKAISDKYTLVNNALVQVAKADPKDRIKVEVGDTKQTDFLPQVKIMRWDNEVNYSLRLKSDEKTPIVEFSGEKTKWKGEKIEAHFYDKPEASEDGGHEFEILLREKPASNKLEFSIETKGLEFFFQPELTQQEKDEGANRPENVIDSYAVYYKDCPANYVDGKLYRTGKAFHIYRIKATDANGVSVWGKQNIDVAKKLHTIELPQEFLGKAVYPVVVDPTFGFSSIGGGWALFPNNQIKASMIAYSGSNGTGNSMSIYAKSGGGTYNVQMALYDASDSSYIIKGKTNSIVLSTDFSWNTASFTEEPNISSDINYYLCFNHNDNYYFMGVYKDSAYPTKSKTMSQSYGSWPSTISWSDDNYNKYSIYVTYTSGGGGTARTPRQGFAFLSTMSPI